MRQTVKDLLDRAGRAGGGAHRIVRWRVHPVRLDLGCEPGQIPRDLEAGLTVRRSWRIEAPHTCPADSTQS